MGHSCLPETNGILANNKHSSLQFYHIAATITLTNSDALISMDEYENSHTL